MTSEDVPELLDLAYEARARAIAEGHSEIRAIVDALRPVIAQQTRNQVAAAIEAACPDPDAEHAAGHCDYRHAAHIARGGAP